jgi:uncharacterized DUF497 family protein
MEIVWDEPKRLANIDKHGLDFADLNEAFFEDALFLPSKKSRYKGIGANVRGIICVVFAKLGREGVSVISMRPASLSERRLYAESLKEE